MGAPFTLPQKPLLAHLLFFPICTFYYPCIILLCEHNTKSCTPVCNYSLYPAISEGCLKAVPNLAETTRQPAQKRQGRVAETARLPAQKRQGCLCRNDNATINKTTNKTPIILCVKSWRFYTHHTFDKSFPRWYNETGPHKRRSVPYFFGVF